MTAEPAAAAVELDGGIDVAADVAAVPTGRLRDRIAQLIEAADELGLPPLWPQLWQLRDRWVLAPWWPTHDVTALLAWARHLDDPDTVQVSSARFEAGDATMLRLTGTLGGATVDLVGSTWREVPADFVGRVDLAVLRQVAGLECGQCAHAPLGPPCPAPAAPDQPAAEHEPAAEQAER